MLDVGSYEAYVIKYRGRDWLSNAGRSKPVANRSPCAKASTFLLNH